MATVAQLSMAVAKMAVMAMLACQAAALEVDTETMKNFGHSIKNGHLVANTEITLFEHNCSSSPCTITQMHCPTAGPGGWEDAVVKLYVDGEPPMSMTLLELANIGNPENSLAGGKAGPATNDQSPWGQALFGHTANKGGVYSTMRVPFGSTFKATLTSNHSGTFWFIIRGVEAYPLVLGDVTLPAEARLRLHRFNGLTNPLDLVTLADIPAGTEGALLNVRFDAAAQSYVYLEACMRALIDGATTPLFLSSGAEDYFLSAYYFDEGEFKTPNSGLTYFDGHGTLSAYKVHDRDPVFFNDGLKLVFRNSEDTTGCGDLQHCPNQYCAPGVSEKNLTAKPDRVAAPRVAATYSTLVWTYEWPRSAKSKMPDSASALDLVVRLGVAGHIDETTEANLIRLISSGDETTITAVGAYAGLGDESLGRAGRVLTKLTQ